MAAVVILAKADPSPAVEKMIQNEDILLNAYHQHETILVKNSIGYPLSLESSDQDGTIHVDVYGIFDHPFSTVLNLLKVPANWCDIASLHPNVRACTYHALPNEWQLTFYIGRKAHQSPEDAHQYTYHYRNMAERQGYLDIVLNADEGPFGTKDHRMRFEALPLPSGRTFVHVSYAYRSALPTRLVGNIYFATFGRGKSGFTVTGTDSSGSIVYIGGQRGAMERNVVRYYLAIQSFMDTLHHPEENRFSMRISQWYDLTSRFRKQLYEMEKKDYIIVKTEDHKKQVILQRQFPTSFRAAPGFSKTVD
jgi:hypothetical protein